MIFELLSGSSKNISSKSEDTTAMRAIRYRILTGMIEKGLIVERDQLVASAQGKPMGLLVLDIRGG